MGDHDVAERGREAFGRRAWSDAFHALVRADAEHRLEADDLERLGMAAYLTGRNEAAVAALERLHHRLLDAGAVGRAATWAFWLAFVHLQAGQHAQGGGWLARAQRLLDEADLDHPARGYLLVPPALQALDRRDGAAALALLEEVAAIAGRFDDPDLTVLGLLGRGQALVVAGDVDRGVRLLDEVMVEVTTGEVSPLVAGIAYCAVIIACRDVFDVRRAQEWTAALSRWCDGQQDLRPYRGQCLVHRSELMQLHGEWSDAMDEVEQACTHLAQRSDDPVMGMARYQQAELLRLTGRFDEAEEAYRQASAWGHPTQPGLALLRLAAGRTGDAAAAIRREVDAAEGDRVQRSRVLAAHVEIELAAGDLAAATAAVDELEGIAADFDSAYLDALADAARGTVQLAAGDAAQACVVLRRAWRSWQSLRAPYEAARVRILLARACRALDDHDTAEMELDAARRVLEELDAAPALAEVDELSRRPGPSADAPGGLTPRELEVLRLVATGATNREIADTLVISEKTVARHLSNMFTKLGLRTRAAATAWAYEHELA
ncbi:MAG: LuxR C-terminal-related transcriptional regulator [Actinobacteria bacterium]|nr:LuxR C-terminal-related transcriptional regulator [Actinomycetota bacterium]